MERLGVMPIYNLGSDAQLDWRGRAASAVVVYDLAGAKHVFASQVDSMTAAQAMQASRLLEGYFVERNGRIAIHAELEDLAKTKAAQVFNIEGPASSGFLPLMNELARRVSPEARTFGTNNEQAFQYYGEALTSKDAQDIERGLQQASQADPGFAAAYVDQAKILSQSGQTDRAHQIFAAAEGARLDPIERANLQYVRASTSGDARGRIQALASLASATPSNSSIFFELGELRFARREFEEAAKEYRAAARLDPNSPRTWNELGYTLAWTGDLKGAREALAQYQKLSPEDENALDSQGEVSYMDGDFKSAADYFERAAQKNPAELVKAAEARLMMGDRPGADALFTKRLSSNAGGRGNAATYQTAQWEYLTGRQNQGVARMEKLASQTSGDLQALALSQLSIWKLDMGDNKAAAELADQAAMRAQSPQMKGIGAMCRYIASGGSGSTGSGSKMADALALLFANRVQEALPLLQAIYNETNPSADGQVRSFLAWAYVRTGAIAEARKLVQVYPLPLSSGDPLFASLTPKMFAFARTKALATK